jgi:hypothetical protein
MNVRQIGLVAILALAVATSAQAQAQAVREPQVGDLKLKTVRHVLQQAPNYSASGSQISDKSPAVFREWLRIEVQFETKPDWVNEIKLVFYAVLGKGAEAKLFKGEVTHVHVYKNSAHNSAMFMHPNAVRRYGNGRVEAVAVMLYYRDRLFHVLSDPVSNVRWWEQFTPQAEPLLNPMQTPWAMLAHEHYEAIHVPPRSP